MLRDPSRKKALLCGRRAGKTALAIRWLIDGMCKFASSDSLFIGLTSITARKQFWKPFCKLIRRLKLPIKCNDTTMTAEHENGSTISVQGSETLRDLEKPRGGGYKRVVIDECGAQRPSYLEYLVVSVLEPALMDHFGELWLMGTCTRQAFGYFHKITTTQHGKGWSVFKWTARDNPHVRWAEYTAELFRDNSWDENNPIYQREYLAEWVPDVGSLVYRFDRTRNIVASLPKLANRIEWRYGLGIDFGFGAATAYTLLAWPERGSRETYVVASAKKHGLAPSQAADWLRTVIDEHDPDIIVADTGGLGKGYVEEFRIRHPGIEVQAAKKDHRRAALEFTSDALLTGRLLSLDSNTDLHAQWSTLLWDEKREDVAEGQDDDIADSAMYAFRESPAYATEDEEPPDDRAAAERDDEDEPQERPYWEEADL